MKVSSETWSVEEYRAFVASGGKVKPQGPQKDKTAPVAQKPEKSRLAMQFEDAWATMETAPKYVTEMRVHPDRLFRYDYCWPEHKVALELQGGIFRVYEKDKGGGHGTPKQFRSDCDKLNLSNLQGVIMFKLATGQVTVENVAMIRDFLISRRKQS